MTWNSVRGLTKKSAQLFDNIKEQSLEQKLAKLAETIYSEGERRFELENHYQQKRRNWEKNISRSREKIKNVRKEKKQLRSRWKKAYEEEREWLKTLYDKVKKKHQYLFRKERKLSRKKEKEETRKEFIKDSFKFAKIIFRESKCDTKMHQRRTWGLSQRNIQWPGKRRLPYTKKLNRPTKSGILFDMSVWKAREVDTVINKTLSRSSLGKDGVSYKKYKKYPRFWYTLFLLLRKNYVAER